MPTIHDLAQGRFLKKEDIDKPKLVTISRYTRENVAPDDQQSEMQYCLHFDELPKPLVLKPVNGQLIATMPHIKSPDFDDWIGKQIVLFVDPMVMMGTKMVGGIRCRAPKAQNFAPAPPSPPPAPKPRPPAPVPAPEPEAGVEDDEVPF